LPQAFLPVAPALALLKEQAKVLNANHLADQIRRLESSVQADPSLAIGTAKELIETCCKTILAERGSFRATTHYELRRELNAKGLIHNFAT
jgi:23S rRNA pseudoU1915 N3-methylase RlmH